MSQLLSAAKHCLMCHKTKLKFLKNGHIEAFAKACSGALDETRHEYELDHIGYEDYYKMQDIVAKLRLSCMRCTGAEAEAYLLIDSTVLPLIESDIEAADKEEREYTKEAMEKRGIKKVGRNVYQATFGKK